MFADSCCTYDDITKNFNDTSCNSSDQEIRLTKHSSKNLYEFNTNSNELYVIKNTLLFDNTSELNLCFNYACLT